MLPVILALWSPDFPYRRAFRPACTAVQLAASIIIQENPADVNGRIRMTEELKNKKSSGTVFQRKVFEKSALGELGGAAGGLEAVLLSF